MTADGAYDPGSAHTEPKQATGLYSRQTSPRRCHPTIIDRKAAPITPLCKKGPPWKEDTPAAITKNYVLLGPALWQGVLEALERILRPKPDRGEDAMPPHPHRSHQPLLSPRHRRERSRGTMTVGRG